MNNKQKIKKIVFIFGLIVIVLWGLGNLSDFLPGLKEKIFFSDILEFVLGFGIVAGFGGYYTYFFIKASLGDNPLWIDNFYKKHNRFPTAQEKKKRTILIVVGLVFLYLIVVGGMLTLMLRFK